MKHFVILGNGGAALSALKAIRSLRPEDPITLISQEDCPAYSPALTTYYLRGTIPYRRMFLCPLSYYRCQRATLLLRKRAIAVEPRREQVVVEGGEGVPYDELLIATGSRPLLPPTPGRELALTLWTARQAQVLKMRTKKAWRIAVVGAGLIGLQILDALYYRERFLTLVEMLPQVLPRVLDGEASFRVEQRLREGGIDLRLGETVEEVRDQGKLKELRLASGAKVEAQVVVFATGVAPNTSALTGSGVRVEQGVVVDETGRTNLEHIYAAGDVAQGPDSLTGRPQVNATWPNALEGGWTAGLNMAGQHTPRPHNIRVNILTPLGLPVASLGRVDPGPGDEEVTRRSPGSYRKLLYHGGRLVGALLVGEVAEVGILANRLARDGGSYERGSAFLELARPLAELYRPIGGYHG